jgi:hypothetical protein
MIAGVPVTRTHSSRKHIMSSVAHQRYAGDGLRASPVRAPRRDRRGSPSCANAGFCRDSRGDRFGLVPVHALGSQCKLFAPHGDRILAPSDRHLRKTSNKASNISPNTKFRGLLIV